MRTNKCSSNRGNAKVIQKMAKTIEFIMSTFFPSLVNGFNSLIRWVSNNITRYFWSSVFTHKCVTVNGFKMVGSFPANEITSLRGQFIPVQALNVKLLGGNKLYLTVQDKRPHRRNIVKYSSDES